MRSSGIRRLGRSGPASTDRGRRAGSPGRAVTRGWRRTSPPCRLTDSRTDDRRQEDPEDHLQDGHDQHEQGVAGERRDVDAAGDEPRPETEQGLGQPGDAEDAQGEGVLDETAHRAQHGAEDLAAADREVENDHGKGVEDDEEGGRAGAGHGIDEDGDERAQEGLQDVLEDGLPHPPPPGPRVRTATTSMVSKPKNGLDEDA